MDEGMSDYELVWEDLPEQVRVRTTQWEKRLQPLVEHPGKWARVYSGAVTTARAYASSLRQRKVRIPEPEHGWEFTSRKEVQTDGSEVGKIYARYNGEIPDDEGEALEA